MSLPKSKYRKVLLIYVLKSYFDVYEHYLLGKYVIFRCVKVVRSSQLYENHIEWLDSAKL